MILNPSPSGSIAILQSAHALLAFQVAEHWGNRATPRPAPRPEVLAAVLLHDAGWDGRELPPRLTPTGLPEAFDTIPGDRREQLWEDAVARAGLRGRYVAYLVSHHISTLALRHGPDAYAGLLRREEARRQELAGQLIRDPRYAQALRTRDDLVNREIVRIVDAISVHLCRGARGTSDLGALPRKSGRSELEMREVGKRTYRLRPWPLIGRRLQVHTEGRALPSRNFPDEASLWAAWERAPTVRLSWWLLAPGAPAVDTPAATV